jgi:hypothetical protein
MILKNGILETAKVMQLGLIQGDQMSWEKIAHYAALSMYSCRNLYIFLLYCKKAQNLGHFLS